MALIRTSAVICTPVMFAVLIFISVLPCSVTFSDLLKCPSGTYLHAHRVPGPTEPHWGGQAKSWGPGFNEAHGLFAWKPGPFEVSQNVQRWPPSPLQEMLLSGQLW